MWPYLGHFLTDLAHLFLKDPHVMFFRLVPFLARKNCWKKNLPQNFSILYRKNNFRGKNFFQWGIILKQMSQIGQGMIEIWPHLGETGGGGITITNKDPFIHTVHRFGSHGHMDYFAAPMQAQNCICDEGCSTNFTYCIREFAQKLHGRSKAAQVDLLLPPTHLTQIFLPRSHAMLQTQSSHFHPSSPSHGIFIYILTQRSTVPTTLLANSINLLHDLLPHPNYLPHIICLFFGTTPWVGVGVPEQIKIR